MRLAEYSEISRNLCDKQVIDFGILPSEYGHADVDSAY